MSNQIDLSGVDDIVDKSELDLSGVDDIVDPAPSLLQKIYTANIPTFQPFADVSLKDIVEGAEKAGQKALDFSVGSAKGITAGSMDELGGLASASLESGLSYIPGTDAYETSKIDEQLKAQGFEVPEEGFWDKYRTYQQASEQAQKEAEERSPGWSLAGQVAGGMTGGAFLGPLLGLEAGAAMGPKALLSHIAQNQGKAKAAMDLLRGTATTGSRLLDLGVKGATSYAKAAPLMAAEAALTSEKQLIGEQKDIPGVLSDVGSNLAFGVPAILGLEATTELAGPALKAAGEKIGAPIEKIGEKIKTAIESEDNPRLRQLYKAYKKYGQEIGIHPRSQAGDIGPGGFAQRDQKAVGGVLDILNSADQKLGTEVGQSLKKATQRGALIDVSPDIQAASKRINDLINLFPDLGQSRRSAAAYDKIMNGFGQLNPIELKTLIDDIDSSIGMFKAATNKGPQDVSTLNELIRFRTNISNTLKKNVPEYRDAASKFEGFRNVLEQIVSGDKPAAVTEKFYGSLRNQQDKLYTNVLDMIQRVQDNSASAQSSRTAFSNFMEALSKFEQANPQKAKQLFDSQELRKFILDASDDSVLRRSSRSVMESRGVVPDLKEAFIGKVPVTGAYLAGKTVKKARGLAQKPLIKGTANLAKRIYNAPAQSLTNVASRLESNGFQSLGKALRESVESGNTYKKNAALFTIMQNPNARILIDENDLSEQENVTDTTTEP